MAGGTSSTELCNFMQTRQRSCSEAKNVGTHFFRISLPIISYSDKSVQFHADLQKFPGWTRGAASELVSWRMVCVARRVPYARMPRMACACALRSVRCAV